MAEYIEKEDLLELYRMDDPVLNENGHVPLPVIRQNIMDIPAADVAPVRHGRWERVIPSKSAAKWSTKVSCSNCHNAGYTRYKYCPNCGCLMLGGED